MKNEDIMRQVIADEIALGHTHFAIVPYGKLGKSVRKELRDNYNVKEEICIDNAGGEGVFKVEEVEWNKLDCYFLLATVHEKIKKELKRELLLHVNEDKIIDVFGQKKECKLIGKLDFLCVGFHKCGTTSLDILLKDHPYIYLPPEKETFFVKSYNRYNDAVKMFRNSYPLEKCKGKLVGGIEPSYWENAEDVYRCFGANLKLLFIVRNPIKATYSYFKMIMRDAIGDNAALKYFEKYEYVSPEMFDAWIRECEYLWGRFRYIDAIEEYLKYYPIENIKVVLFEELLDSTMDVMNDIQKFIGLENKDIQSYSDIPHVNEGTKVCREYACALLNNAMRDLINKTRDEDLQLALKLMWWRDQCGEILGVEYKKPMLDKTEEKLKKAFEESINRLEEFIGRRTNW